MKRFFTLITIMTMAGTSAMAQSAATRWQFGAMLGPQVSFAVPKQEGSKATKGIMAGVDVGYRFQEAEKGWSVHVQPYFAGARAKNTSGAENTNFYLTLKSKSWAVNAPLLIRYTFLDGKIRPFAELGAHYMVGGRFSYKVSGFMCPEGVYCEPTSEELKNQKAGGPRITALASAGVVVDAGKVSIPITIRLIENVKKLETYDIGGVEYKFPKSRVIQVTAGVSF